MDGKVIFFDENNIWGVPLPQRFTYPFYYQPHALAIIAADQLKAHLEAQAGLDHNFGLDKDAGGMAIGKMFGILVIQDTNGRLGYLSAFSGKLANSNDHSLFVPPVFDMLTEGSFFLTEQYQLNEINARVKVMESDLSYLALQKELKEAKVKAELETADLKKLIKANKNDRKQQRVTQQEQLTPEAYTAFEAVMIKQSLHDKHRLVVLTAHHTQRINELNDQIARYTDRIDALKKERKERSAALQQQLFEQYSFLNQYKQSKSLYDIFRETTLGVPPSAAGECATPKLLQYAFLNGYKPLAMAEFWWGASPRSEVRVHGQYYPACNGKCKPILKHMLEGIAIDDDPLLHNPGEFKPLNIVHEDDSLIVVNKPYGLLSVPGINISDSVLTRLRHRLKDMEPLMVHRLDMDTSGLLVIAKTKDIHKNLQRQFLKRTVSKRYVALLSKIIDGNEGEISLPLRADLDDRPRQLVCFEQGRKAITQWKVVEHKDGRTKIHFWPLTGRTHQLRMHAAHELGLHAPIVGDDLYGTPAQRLYLHAAFLEFVHPATKAKISFEIPEEF